MRLIPPTPASFSGTAASDPVESEEESEPQAASPTSSTPATASTAPIFIATKRGTSDDPSIAAALPSLENRARLKSHATAR